MQVSKVLIMKIVTGEKWVQIYIRKNSKNIDESFYYSRYTGKSGYALDQGGRTIVTTHFVYLIYISILIYFVRYWI